MKQSAFATLDSCVHCGFCLQSCPTFLVTGDEADSPRGRIVLMQGLARGELDPADEHLVHHLDRCLGCRGCEPVCPSGVGYGAALEAARHLITTARPISGLARLVLAIMADPVLRAPAMFVARTVRPLAKWFLGDGRMGFAWGMLDATRRVKNGNGGLDGGSSRHAGDREPAQPHLAGSPSRGTAVVFEGCIMRGLFAHVNDATERVLAVNGYDIAPLPAQGCCGALHAHAGDADEAMALARRNVAAFSSCPEAAIVVNSAGCGAMLKQYGTLLAGEPAAEAARAVAARVRDISEVLDESGPVRGGTVDVAVSYDPPCHLEHAQRVVDQPRRLLEMIPGLRLVSHEGASLCCGSAGIYSLVEPGLSRDVLAMKVEAITHASPDVVATGNPGCLMQIGAGLRAARRDTPVVHPVELLDDSYSRAGFYLGEPPR